uniref:FAS-associated factor 1 n=1 Tax=Lygus hesperus TaxID=30085 RepID=A0A0A9W1J4_LYGHE
MSKEDTAQAQIVHEFVMSFNRAVPDFPLMFRGTLDKAISACWPKNAKLGDRRRMLALYVQKGFDEGFRKFVECLSSPRMKMILMESFVVWGWDVEDPERFTDLMALVIEKLDEAGKEIAPELKNNPFPKMYLMDKPHDVITLTHKISELPSEDQMFLELEAIIRPKITGSVDKLQPMDFREKRKSTSTQKETLGDRIERRASIIAEHQKGAEAAKRPDERAGGAVRAAAGGTGRHRLQVPLQQHVSRAPLLRGRHRRWSRQLPHIHRLLP